MRLYNLALCWLILILLIPGAAFAQAQGNTGGGGTAGGGLFGSTGGQSLFGSSTGGTFDNSSGFSNQLSSGLGTQSFDFSQTAMQQEGFVGRDNQDTGAMFEALNQSGAQFLNQMERTFGGGNRGRGTNQANNTRPPIRVNLKLGFRAPQPRPQNQPTPTVQRLNVLLTAKGFDATATLDNGVAVLTGAVEDASERRMLEKLMKLEPGVREVDNRLTVTATTIER